MCAAKRGRRLAATRLPLDPPRDATQGRVLNALDACAKLGCDAEAIDAAWGAAKKAKKLVKFGGGFYCGLVELEGKEPLYTLNAFFMSMRAKFTSPDAAIHYFAVRAGRPPPRSRHSTRRANRRATRRATRRVTAGALRPGRPVVG